MSQFRSFSNTGRQGPEVLADALVDRSQRLKACPGTRGIDPHHITHKMINGYKHRDNTLSPSLHLCSIGTLHLVWRLGDDTASR